VFAGGEGVQQGENAGIGEGDSENDRSGNGKDHDNGGQQTPHVRPTFPSTSSKINGLSPVHPVARGPVRLLYPR
jgi:hypothetical protein